MRAKALFLLVVIFGLAVGQDPTESPVTKGSGWFPRQQQEDGSWRAEAGHAPAVTGLVLLSYLGAGYTDRGTERENRYARSVRRGFRYLMDQQDEQGCLDENLRHHAIATLALTEVFWITSNPRYKRPAQRAVDYLARAQKADGSWGDILTTGWAVKVLKSARFARLEVPPDYIAGVRRWLGRQTPGGENPRLAAAVTTLVRIFLGDDPRTNEAIQKGAEFCAENPPVWEQADHIYWYFGTLATFQAGGTAWRRWNENMKDAIVKNQHQRGSGDRTGSWDPAGATATEFGRAGTTALLTMCLEVYYRYDRVFGVKGHDEEPVVPEEILDHNEVDTDTEYEESGGEDGLSDAPFEGPSTNSAIGLGGGDGGSMRGRGGSRNLRAGGGKGGRSSKPTVRTWKRSSLVPHTSQLKVGDKETLPLEKLEVKVRVDGFRARVVLDCYYKNDRDRQLEGTFKLRLPDGASPYFFAFGAQAVTVAAAGKPPAWDSFEPEAIVKSREGWTAPKVARVVPRARAARAYTETVRRKIDPALLEWAGAGIFNARVFPLEPKKLHRIVLAYDVNLVGIGEHLEYRLDLPEKVPALDVAFKVDAAHATVTPYAEAHEGHYAWKDPVERKFAVRVPDPGAVLLRGADPTGPYFAVRLRPDLPSTDVGGHRRAVFLVDTSLSSNPERFRVWLRLLRAILKNNRDTLEEFAVVCFNVEQFRWREGFVANTPENLALLTPFLEGMALEGATDLAGALRSVAGEDADLFLLSDGAATWGPSAMPEVKGTLFTYTTGLQGTETATLQRLARASGGAVFAVTGEAEVAAASRAHRRRPWHIFDLAVEGGSDLLLAGRPRSVFPGQTLLLAGRGRPAPDADVVLTLQQGERTHWVRVPLARTVVKSPLAPRVYGQIAVGQLEETGVAAETVAESYAVQFRVPGRTCSLLMLDSEEDYLRFGIKPEETALAVRMQPVNETLRNRQAGTTRKAELVARLTRLERARGLDFKLSAPLRILLDRLPDAAFDVRPEKLECRERGWRSVPGSVQEQLASHTLAYDVIAAEAERRRKESLPDDALRAWSSLVEEHPGDVAVSRDVAFGALEAGFPGHAYHLFRRVAERRPHEPQTYLALAESLAALDSPLAVLYHEVVLGADWSGRVGALREIGRASYLRLLRRLAADGKDSPLRTYVATRLEGLAAEFQAADLVVLMEWSTDGTDIDLHVTDPTGEECYYSHDQTKMGGRITDDVTTGFGPEMFLLPKAAPGEYLVRAHYYGERSNRLSMRTKVFVTLVRHWGTAREEVTRKVVTLGREKEMKELARIRID
jgi:hypothetical protein